MNELLPFWAYTGLDAELDQRLEVLLGGGGELTLNFVKGQASDGGRGDDETLLSAERVQSCGPVIRTSLTGKVLVVDERGTQVSDDVLNVERDEGSGCHDVLLWFVWEEKGSSL
jgi:hypothetical protein